MADIVYTFEDSVYLNITNRCPCACTFCIRANGDGLGSAETLWHDADPALADVFAAIDAFDFSRYDEAVFCGYGEPTCAFDNLIKTADYLRARHPSLRLRINTNGLSDLINGRPTAAALCRAMDVISISLNAADAAAYVRVSQPEFGEAAYPAMLRFAEACRDHGADVRFTVVDIISEEEVAACQAVADRMGIPLRVRAYSG